MLKLAYSPRLILFWLAPLVLFVLILFVGANSSEAAASNWYTLSVWLFIAFGVGAAIAYNASNRRREYELQVTGWNAAVEYTNPAHEIVPDFEMLDGEIAYYSMTSQRYAERWVAQDIRTTTGGGLAPAVVGGVAFGAAGAVAGAVIGKKVTTGTATNVYDVVVVDTGTLTVTNRRYLFLGSRHTVIVQKENLIRASSPEETFLVLEYEGRPAGEMFSIDKYAFRMAMVRRAKDPRYDLPFWPGAVLDNPPQEMPLPKQIDGVLPVANQAPERQLPLPSAPKPRGAGPAENLRPREP